VEQRAARRRPGSGITLAPGLLRHYRKARGWDRQRLATESHISYDTIVSVELGRQRPRPATLTALCAALGIAPADLLPPPEGSTPP